MRRLFRCSRSCSATFAWGKSRTTLLKPGPTPWKGVCGARMRGVLSTFGQSSIPCRTRSSPLAVPNTCQLAVPARLCQHLPVAGARMNSVDKLTAQRVVQVLLPGAPGVCLVRSGLHGPIAGGRAWPLTHRSAHACHACSQPRSLTLQWPALNAHKARRCRAHPPRQPRHPRVRPPRPAAQLLASRSGANIGHAADCRARELCTMHRLQRPPARRCAASPSSQLLCWT